MRSHANHAGDDVTRLLDKGLQYRIALLLIELRVHQHQFIDLATVLYSYGDWVDSVRRHVKLNTS
eukprot:COSAG02_NODE_9654_length_2150_cov_2.605558_2_plen_65_part_00